MVEMKDKEGHKEDARTGVNYIQSEDMSVYSFCEQDIFMQKQWKGYFKL